MNAVMTPVAESPKAAARRLSAAAIQEGFVAVALHTYTAADGTPLHYRIRLKHPDGRKHIRPMRMNGEAFVLGEPEYPDGKPLYRLDEIAANPAAPVWYVEGEVCADNLADLGVLTTTVGGATSDDKADFGPLAKRTVTVWPDNDQAGLDHAQRVAEKLQAIGCNVDLIDAQRLGLPEGGDCVDYLQTHSDIALAALGKLPRKRPKEPIPPRRIIALEIGELLTRKFPPKERMLGEWLRKQDIVMVHAWRGVGKTHFTLNVAYAVASGGSFLDWTAEAPRRVLYIDGEMPGATIKERVSELVLSNGARQEPPSGYFRIVTPDAQEDPIPDLATADGQDAIEAVIEDADLIVVDNLSTLCRTGLENEGESWLPLAAWALRMRREGRAVLFVHHSGKGGKQRGTSRREDLLDVVLMLKHPGDYNPEEGARFEIHFEKARGLFGDAVRSIEAKLVSDHGKALWTHRNIEAATQDQVIELAKLDMSVTDIALEVGVNKSTVSRALKKAREAGLLPGKGN